jgi:hypothetical protein
MYTDTTMTSQPSPPQPQANEGGNQFIQHSVYPKFWNDPYWASTFNRFGDNHHLWLDNYWLTRPRPSGTPGFDTICWISGMPHADEARTMLRLMQRMFLPLMQKYNLSIWRLEEYYPEVPASGATLPIIYPNGAVEISKIQVRLRCWKTMDRLLHPWSVINTLLHELAHATLRNGGHGVEFYRQMLRLHTEFFESIEDWAGEWVRRERCKIQSILWTQAAMLYHQLDGHSLYGSPFGE